MYKLVVSAIMIGLLGACSSVDPVDERYKELSNIYDIPQDPGKASDATIQGIDSNKNGIRDDIEREIYLLADVAAIDKNYPELREHLLAVARELGFILIVNNKEIQQKRAMQSVLRAKQYIRNANKQLIENGKSIDENRLDVVTDKGLTEMISLIEKKVFNTSERKKVYRDVKRNIRHNGVLLV